MKFALKSLNGLSLPRLLATAGAGAMAQGTDAAPAALNPVTSARQPTTPGRTMASTAWDATTRPRCRPGWPSTRPS